MRPARKGDGTGLSFPGYSEVRTGDGDVVWTAGPDIPDSVIAQYNAQSLTGNDGDTVSAFPDAVSNYDATGGDATIVDSGINGNRSLDFSAATAGYSNTDFAVSQKITIISVVERTTSSENIHTVYGDIDNLLHYFRGDLEEWKNYAGGDLDGSGDNTTRLHTTVFDGANSVVREGGTQVRTGDIGTGSLDRFSIGSGYNEVWDSLIGFIEIHVGEPANGIATREQEVADNWGITI